MQQNKKKPSVYKNDSFLEQLRSFSDGASNSLKNDVFKGGIKSAWNQFTGIESETSYETLTPAEKIEKKETLQKGSYETKQEFILFSARERQTAREVEAIRTELIALVKTVKEVDFEIQKAVREIPVKPGVYHVRFLERLKAFIKLIRERLEDSCAWLRLFMSKKKQKNYWCQYKKKGTSFGLSGERVVSTQTG